MNLLEIFDPPSPEETRSTQTIFVEDPSPLQLIARLLEKYMPHTQRVTVGNTKKAPVVVCVEPWFEEFTLQPGESLELEFVGKSKDAVQIDADDRGGITVWGLRRWTKTNHRPVPPSTP